MAPVCINQSPAKQRRFDKKQCRQGCLVGAGDLMRLQVLEDPEAVLRIFLETSWLGTNFWLPHVKQERFQAAG